MKKNFRILALLALAPFVFATNASAQNGQIVATPVQSQTTILPEDGRSMFDRGQIIPETPAAKPAETGKDNAANANSTNANAPANSAAPNALTPAAGMTPNESAYDAIWRNMLGYTTPGSWKTDAPTPSLALDATWIKANALQTSQNARLIEQNDLLMKQNDQIIALLRQIAGDKNVSAKVTSAKIAPK